MSRFIIIYDALNARATLAADADEPRRELARGILRAIHGYLADHMDRCPRAGRLAGRDDPDARAMPAFVDEMLAAYANAEMVAREAIARARLSPSFTRSSPEPI